MNNFLRVMALSENEVHRVTFVSSREEGGINAVYDPEQDKFLFQVFIHNRFPYTHKDLWEFESFAEARSFAARHFDQDWELLAWDQKVSRPCADGGTECGSGSCPTCKSLKADNPDAEGSPCGSCH
ncbi:MAG: hypothetical protein JST16_05985 [Bdellovibrionales bacterium]|nr:hypothetical protein [Bdellovibrionales bacterium]